MRKILTAAVAALTLGGAVAVTAPAEARPYGYYGGSRYYHRGHHGNDAAVAVAAGVVGLALGAAIANNNGYGGRYYGGGYARPYYGGGYYNQPYYGGGYYSQPGYYGGGGYGVCSARRLVWDPYIQRRVEVHERYAC